MRASAGVRITGAGAIRRTGLITVTGVLILLAAEHLVGGWTEGMIDRYTKVRH